MRKLSRKCTILAIISIFVFYSCFLHNRVLTFHELFNYWKVSLDKDKLFYKNTVFELKDLLSTNKKFLSFLYLPVHFKNSLFSEISSANPNTKYPLGPDFTFHLEYSEDKIKFFEDFGCGCISRVYLLPPFTGLQERIDKLTSTDLEKVLIILKIDEEDFSFSLKNVFEAETYPFLQPFSHKNTKPKSGINFFYPFCYNKTASVFLVNDHKYPSNLLNLTVDCISNEISCPVKQYTTVSYTKFSQGAKFNALKVNADNKNSLDTLSYLLKYPNIYGPDSKKKCILNCKEVNGASPTLLFSSDTDGIINSLSINIRNLNFEVLNNWKDMFLIVHVDDEIKPSINITLDLLFITKGFDNDFKGAAFGRLKRSCLYYFEQNYMGKNYDMTGYFHLPILYWHKIEILITGKRFINFLVCYQIIHSINVYEPSQAGYLHSQQTFYDNQVDKWREFINVSGGWGHLVGVIAEIINLKPNLHGKLVKRWAALQADPVIYIDGSYEPRVKGTGFEDYFGYSHGFAEAENSSYSFTGVPYAFYDSRQFSNSWICYRQHLMDPVAFDERISFIMEGTDHRNFMFKAEPISHQNFDRKMKDGETVFQFMSFYYFRKHSKDYSKEKACDRLVFGNKNNLGHHSFKTKSSTTLFLKNDLKYIGDSRNNKNIEKVEGLEFQVSSMATARFKLPKVSTDRKLVLSQVFYSPPFSWNPKLSIVVNNISLGIWLVAMGSTNEEYSLRNQTLIISDRVIAKSINKFYDYFDFEIIFHSKYYLISLELCSIPII